ncbi:MAG: SPOR domain-containing protein [Burkholderiaceae bacterium]|nr:SPOR domain-containing protein [Burkholderiaceae bacterium]
MRALLVALAAANVLVLAWSLNWLPFFSLPREREPERLQRQVRPEAVQLITPSAASAALQAAAAQRAPGGVAAAPGTDGGATVCLEAGPFAASEVAAAERALRDLKLTNLEWTQQRSERGGSYIVYHGRFADNAALQRRRAELQRQQISAEPVTSSPDLEPGLSFGRFDTRAAADAALAQIQQQGVRPSRVVTINTPVIVTLLRVERADGPMAARLTQLSLPPAGSGFRPCATPP